MKKSYIHTIEKKIAKTLGLLYHAKQLLNKKSLKMICFSYIHSYLNYANVAWASKLKAINYQRNHAAQIVFN